MDDNLSVPDIKVIETKKGTKYLVIENFRFRIDKKLESAIYWRCCTTGCTSRCRSDVRYNVYDEIPSAEDHNHKENNVEEESEKDESKGAEKCKATEELNEIPTKIARTDAACFETKLNCDTIVNKSKSIKNQQGEPSESKSLTEDVKLNNVGSNVKVIQSMYGKRILVIDNFKFRVDKKTENKIYWRCYSELCKSRCNTDIFYGELTFPTPQHNHTYEAQLKQFDRRRNRKVQPVSEETGKNEVEAPDMMTITDTKEFGKSLQKMWQQQDSKRDTIPPQKGDVELAAQSNRSQVKAQSSKSTKDNTLSYSKIQIIDVKTETKCLVIDDYRFKVGKRTGNSIYWRCSTRSCKSQCRTNLLCTEMFSSPTQHNHKEDMMDYICDNPEKTAVMQMVLDDLDETTVKIECKEVTEQIPYRDASGVEKSPKPKQRKPRTSKPAGHNLTPLICASPDQKIQIFETEKGGKSLVFDDHQFRVDKIGEKIIYWRCKKANCKSRCRTTLQFDMFSTPSNHNHENGIKIELEKSEKKQNVSFDGLKSNGPEKAHNTEPDPNQNSDFNLIQQAFQQTSSYASGEPNEVMNIVYEPSSPKGQAIDLTRKTSTLSRAKQLGHADIRLAHTGLQQGENSIRFDQFYNTNKTIDLDLDCSEGDKDNNKSDEYNKMTLSSVINEAIDKVQHEDAAEIFANKVQSIIRPAVKSKSLLSDERTMKIEDKLEIEQRNKEFQHSDNSSTCEKNLVEGKSDDPNGVRKEETTYIDFRRLTQAEITALQQKGEFKL